MWQQVTSGTPIGDVALRRVIFKTEGATYGDVRDAIASHRRDDKKDSVTLVVERAVNSSTPISSYARPQLESLPDIIKRDLKKGSASDSPIDKLSPGERARRLLEFSDTRLGARARQQRRLSLLPLVIAACGAPPAARAAGDALAAGSTLVSSSGGAEASLVIDHALDASRFAFVSPLDPRTGELSMTNLGKDVLLSDIYGLPAAFAYLGWVYSRDGTLNNAWPPSVEATALWVAAVALASSVVAKSAA